jgi:hypothetical protein
LTDNTIIPGCSIIIDETHLARIIVDALADLQRTHRRTDLEDLAAYLNIPHFILQRTVRIVPRALKVIAR